MIATAGLLVFPRAALADDGSPAGGAATGEVIVATAMGLVATALVTGPILLYRRGRFAPLGRLADRVGGATGLPGWAALPLAVLGGSLIIAVFGMYWDISLHIDEGRDAGPLANPAHHFILVGLLGVTAAGVLGMALPARPIRSSLHIRGPEWDAPAGAIMIIACGAFSLTAFPLDDVWHRVFGQDVTLWSPAHLMLITGASLSTLGGFALYREALEEGDRGRAVPARAGWLMAPLAGAFLIGLNTYMAEFDFGVPQFRLDLHPVGLMMASGLALVSARLMIGPWGAVATVGFFLLIRGFLTAMVGPVLGQTEPHFPLYAAEAAVVEAVALAFVRTGRPPNASPATFGAVAGIGIGTVGLAAEWGWSHLWAQHPWVSPMLPEAALLGLAMAVAAGTMGGFIGRALTVRGSRLPTAGYWALILPTAIATAVILYALPISAGDGGTSASLRLTDVGAPSEREVQATIRIDPPDAAEDARWFTVTSWQGGGSVVQEAEEVGAGTYRTAEPIPVHGSWKSILRLHREDEVIGMPIFMPRDTAIPAEEVPAPPGFRRDFVLDQENLQREQKEGVSAALTTSSYLAVLAITVLLLLILFWGLRRIQFRLGSGGEPPPPRGRRLPAERPATVVGSGGEG